MSKLFRLLNEVRKDEEGVTMVEYALLLGIISIAAIAVIVGVGSAVNTKFACANTALATNSVAGC